MQERGEAREAFESADVVVEKETTTSTVHQGYIEPHSVTVSWDDGGRVRVWTSTQGSFYVREMLAVILGIPEHDIQCIPMEIGGGFGGKFELYEEPVAALMSRKTGRPVKMTMSRAEELEASGPAPGTSIWLRMGATNDGRITALEAWLAYESGAFPDTPISGGARRLTDVYRVPNYRIESLEVIVNKPKSGWLRAPAGPQVTFALEQAVDELASRLGLDPIELRLMNIADDEGLREVLHKMSDHPHWNDALEGENRGRGVAISFGGHGGGNTTCVLTLNEDGTASLIEGCTDIGGSRVAIAMQVAESLGIRSEDVIPQVGDTDSVGYNMGTSGGRTTYAVGIAAFMAAEDVKRQLVERVAKVWNLAAETLEYKDGSVRSTVDTALAMGFKEVAAQLSVTGGPVVGSASVNPDRGKGESVGFIVDVQVDRETGKVHVERCTAVMDVGKAIHPSYVEGQMQGGVVQGLGWALGEAYWYDDQGRLANTSFLDYRMMTALDVPMVETVIVEVPNPNHPYGAKAASEAQISPPGSALANAICDAVGVRMDALPMNPEAVSRALETVSE